jgi:uncharacterized protein YvpB
MVVKKIEVKGFMIEKEIFTSQHNQTVYEEEGCGVASMMMLLKYINFKPIPSWQELCEDLSLAKDPILKGYQSDDPEIGLYPEDLFRYVIRRNFHFRMHCFDDEWQEALLHAPIMVLLDGILDEFPTDAHWVVLTRLHEGYFSYLDPWEKSFESAIKSISFQRFKQVYTGLACQLLNTEDNL